MGTRASFWVGNPQDLEHREWLGCVAWDGYPCGFDGALEKIQTEADFRAFVAEQSKREDFARPGRGWPYPWDGDIFLTDYSYAFFPDGLRLTCYHHGWQTLAEHDAENQREDDAPEEADKLPDNVPAPEKYGRGQPDSIMIFTAR